MPGEITFTSRLSASHQSDLEQLIFFNPDQTRFQDRIVQSIESFGMPSITKDDGHLRVSTDRHSEVQTIFALERSKSTENLIGVLLYLRVSTDKLVVLHVGIDERYLASGSAGDRMLYMSLMAELRSIARRVRGIAQLEILYGSGRTRTLPVHSSTSRKSR